MSAEKAYAKKIFFMDGLFLWNWWLKQQCCATYSANISCNMLTEYIRTRFVSRTKWYFLMTLELLARLVRNTKTVKITWNNHSFTFQKSWYFVRYRRVYCTNWRVTARNSVFWLWKFIASHQLQIFHHVRSVLLFWKSHLWWL